MKEKPMIFTGESVENCEVLARENEKLREASRWKYPARGEWSDVGKKVEVTLHTRQVDIGCMEKDGFWRLFVMSCRIVDVRAWRELPESAPELEVGT